MPFYAVAKGWSPGVYNTWDECRKQIKSFKYAKYKKFETEVEANLFIHNSTVTSCSKTDSVKIIECDSSEKPQLLEAIEPIMKKIDEVESLMTSIKSSLCDLRNQFLRKNQVSKRKNPFEDEDEIASKICELDKKVDLQFKYDANGFVEVYTDGACEQNGKMGAKAGLGVFFGDGHSLNTSEPCKGRATNNCGEIQAAIKAVQLVKPYGITKLCIHTDSMFLINSMTKWIEGWKRNDWKTVDGKPVKNKVDFEELYEEIQNLHIKWIYVRGHSGIHGNVMADNLARLGAARYGRI